MVLLSEKTYLKTAIFAQCEQPSGNVNELDTESSDVAAMPVLAALFETTSHIEAI